MKNLVLGTMIAAAASQAAGCIISSSTDEGHIRATWTFQNISQTGQTNTTSCPPGYDTAALHTVAASPDGTALDACTSINSNCYIDLFNCSDGSGVSASLPAQNYLTWVEITDTNGANTYATSTSAFVDITNVDLTYSTEILNNGGYFLLRWSLQGEQSGAPLTCSETAAAKSAGGSVETIATLASNNMGFTDRFDCEDHFDYSAGLPEGVYSISVDALDSQDRALSSQSNIINNALIGTQPNDITDLGHVIIPIAGQ
jgi:hypothetical protein